MDRKIFTIVLAVVLIGCFFLPVLKFWGGEVSGYDLVLGAAGKSMPAWKYVLLIAPLCGVLLLIGALNNENYPLGRPVLTWLPLLSLISFIVILYLYFSNGREGMDDEGGKIAIGDLFKIMGVGYWISLGGSLILAFYNPKAKA